MADQGGGCPQTRAGMRLRKNYHGDLVERIRRIGHAKRSKPVRCAGTGLPVWGKLLAASGRRHRMAPAPPPCTGDVGGRSEGIAGFFCRHSQKRAYVMDSQQTSHLYVGFDSCTQELVSAERAQCSNCTLLPMNTLNFSQRLHLAKARWSQGAWEPLWVGDQYIDAETLEQLSPKDFLYSFLVDFEVRVAAMQMESVLERKDGREADCFLPVENAPLSPPVPRITVNGVAVAIDLNIQKDATELQYKSKARQDELKLMKSSFTSVDEYAGANAVRNNVIQGLSDPLCNFVSFTGHAIPIGLYDHDKKYLLTTKDKDLQTIAKNKIFFLHSCLTCAKAVGLGQALVQKGARAVFGYESLLLMSADKSTVTKFTETYYAAENAMLMGEKASVAYTRGQTAYASAITYFKQAKKDREAAMMEHNKYYFKGPDKNDTVKTFGDPDAKL